MPLGMPNESKPAALLTPDAQWRGSLQGVQPQRLTSPRKMPQSPNPAPYREMTLSAEPGPEFLRLQRIQFRGVFAAMAVANHTVRREPPPGCTVR
jgi:hypothetical protein